MARASLSSFAALACAVCVGCDAHDAGPGPPPLEQHRVTSPGDLLSPGGALREPGWATTNLLAWNPANVADLSRLRQWDFFTIMSPKYAVNVTLADVSLVIGSVNVVDLSTQTLVASLTLGSKDELTLSSAPGGDASIGSASAPEISFHTVGGDTTVTIDITEPFFSEPSHGTFVIHRRPELPFLSLATPFRADPHQFFYEQKIPGLSAEGSLTIGAQTFTFDAGDTTAVMDWGRGQWPSAVHWLWATGAGTVDGAPFALNLGTVLGNETTGTENIVFFDDAPSKLGRVLWAFDPAQPMKDWRFHDEEGRLDLTLHPVAPEVSNLDLGAQYMHVRKAYGTFSGTVALDDGRELVVDGLLGAAEQQDAAW